MSARMMGLAAALLIWSAAAQGDEIFVPDNYATIQGAIDAAFEGDIVVVRPGAYPENIDFRGKAITVRSDQGPAVTAIDGGAAGSVATFWTFEGPDSVLEGFTLTNGDSMGLGGGGVYCFDAKPTIRGNVITGNAEDGIHCSWNGLGAVTGNVIESNAGDGIACTDTGGAIENNEIRQNGGAGIRLSSAEAVIAGNVIGMNSNGGIRCEYGYFDSVLTNNVIFGNTALKGGGVYWHLSRVIMTNNTIYGNSADAGGGIYCEDSLEMIVTNTILWGNDAFVAPEIYVDSVWFSASFAISYSDVASGQASLYAAPSSIIGWGAGMIDADPVCVDVVREDFHLTYGSACRGAGDPAAPAFPAFDFEGDPRPDQCVDIGADSFYSHLYAVGAASPGSAALIRIAGQPGAAIRLALGSGVRDSIRVTPYGDLYLMMPFHLFVAGVVPPSGNRSIHALIPPEWAAGDQKPLQALLGKLGGSETRLTNLLLLTIE